jgi:RNA polymerase-binding transcription factor DksA
MADEADMADMQIQDNINFALRNRKAPKPEFNHTGEKVCIDCDIVIPKARAAIDIVVRCINCQQEIEK